jgi:hypothetical protein
LARRGSDRSVTRAAIATSLQDVRLLDDLGLHAGRREQEVHDDRARVFSRRLQTNGREAAGGLLLQGGEHPVARAHESTHEGLGVPIVGRGHGQVDVAREAGLCAG